MGFRILAICFVILFAQAPVGALTREDTEGVWYRYLDDPGPSFENSHYRLEVFGFFQDSAGQARAFHCQIYPNPSSRTLLRLGTLGQPKKNDPQGFTVEFDQTHFAEARNLLQPKGFPVSTYLDIKGLKPARANQELQLADKKINDEGTQTMVINGKLFRSLRDDLLRLSKTSENSENAREFLRLFFLHIYFIEARIPEFGTMAMVGKNEKIPALNRGYMQLEFQSRGFLGLGNSGVMFIIEGASEFPGLYVRGNVFGGVYHMEGSLSLYTQGKDGLEFLGAMDCSKVKLSNGVASEGDFYLTFPSKDGANRIVAVPSKAIAQ